jgi:hypothetical protein
MRRFLLIVGFTLIALAALVGLNFDRIVDGMLRPWAVTKAATALDGEVRLDRLELGWGRLELTGVQAVRSGEFRLKVERVIVRYTFAGLWQRRLESVAVRQPDLEWEGAAAADGGSALWPRQPPLRVGDWTVEEGRLLLPLGKDRLLLRQLEAAGNLDSRYTFEAAAVLGSEPGVALALSGHGIWKGRPELTITHLLWSGRSLLPAPVTLTPGAESFEVTLALAQLNDAEAARLLAAFDREPPWPPELAWGVTAPRLTVGVDGERLSLRLESAAGEVRREGERWPWESLHLQLATVAGVWEVDGEAALSAQGRLHLAGVWSEERFRGRWRFAVPSPAELGTTFGFALPSPAGRLRELTVAGDLQAMAGTVAVDRVQLVARLSGGGEFVGALSGRWQEGAASVEATDLVVRQGASRLATASFKLVGRPAETDWRGDWRLQVPDLLRLAQTLAVTVPAGLPNLQELELQGELATAGGRLLLPKVKMNGRLLGTGLSGRVSGQLTARQLAAGWRFEAAQLAATELEYLSPDGLSGVTGGSLQLAGALALQEDVTFALKGEAAAGEALAGSWYADLGGLPLRLVLDGGWAPETGRAQLRSGRLDLAGLVSARLQGSLAGKRLQLHGEIVAPRLDGAFQARLRQLAVGVLPGIERLELAGGLTASATGGWSPEGWDIEATVRPAGVTLAWGEAVRWAGLTGELPLLLQRGPASPAAERLATLKWDELQAGPVAAAGGQLLVRAGLNRWRLDETLRLAAGGGWLELAEFALALPATGPEMRASLKATGVELAEITRTLGWPEMGGRLGAELSDIRFVGEEISVGGEALLQVFDGAVRLGNMRVNKPFSRYPTYHADIDFSGIDLQLLTQAFAFGEINGVADGFVRELRLFGPVPSAFRAVFETREKGTRNISVKALRNLNAFSHGGLSAVLSRGIYRFIDFYRYRKIGIRCWLRNDVFHLEGTAKPGTDTYLIYGGWLPPRIDVIVTTPTVSFQEMIKRLKRIERAER